MLAPQSKTINGHTWSASPLPGMRALRLYPLAARGVAGGFMNLLPDDMEHVCRELLAMVRVDGKELTPKVLELDLAGHVNVLLQDVLPFSFEVNYGRNGDFSGAAPAPVEAARPSPDSTTAPTSGSAGDSSPNG